MAQLRKHLFHSTKAPVLDLHGTKHATAREKVEDFLLANEPPMHIITGNSEEMRKIVVELLAEYNCGHGFPASNPGQIDVLTFRGKSANPEAVEVLVKKYYNQLHKKHDKTRT